MFDHSNRESQFQQLCYAQPLNRLSVAKQHQITNTTIVFSIILVGKSVPITVVSHISA